MGHTIKEVNDFFNQEEQHWQLVRQASLNGDENAIRAMSLLAIISENIDVLWRYHEILHSHEDPETYLIRMVECNRVEERIANLIRKRRAILYEDYGILKKKMQIYIDTIQRQMIDRPILEITIN